ncbi:hypothetical protein WT33_33440 [Burkholderia stagnalis]|nr:hypothetical protein WT33_33440 [Burkholderia stagnalis]
MVDEILFIFSFRRTILSQCVFRSHGRLVRKPRNLRCCFDKFKKARRHVGIGVVHDPQPFKSAVDVETLLQIVEAQSNPALQLAHTVQVEMFDLTLTGFQSCRLWLGFVPEDRLALCDGAFKVPSSIFSVGNSDPFPFTRLTP